MNRTSRSPMPDDAIPFGKPAIVGNELAYIAEAVRAGELSGDRAFTGLCHAWLEDRCDSLQALLTHSCTAALEMSAILAGVGPGDEVVMPSYTFVSTANAFVMRGATPVFVDVRPEDLTIDPELAEKAITSRTKAIVPVHYAGVPSDMGALMRIADSADLLVIEDAAQAMQGSWEGKPLGSIGHLGCLSFHETKNVTSGEGGALLVNDERFAERAEVIREKGTNRRAFSRGMVDKYTWTDVGSSYLPGEIIAAFLYAQLERAEQITAERRAVVRRYEDGLRPWHEAGRLSMAGVDLSAAGNGHMFYFFADDAQQRHDLLDHLRRAGVGAVFHYVPLHSSPAGERYGRVASVMSVTDDRAARLVRLPVYNGLTSFDQNRVIEAVREFYGRL